MRILKKIGLVLLYIFGGLAGLYVLLFILSYLLINPVAKMPWYAAQPGDHTPLVLAHQGGEGEYPSNSNLAFAQAVVAGTEVLDTDMHMTKDGVLVLFHDETLDFRTNGKGAIRDHTLAELKQVDFAYNWTQDGGKTFPYRGKGISVYTVNELFSGYKSVRYGIEIKQTTTQAAVIFCDLIKQYKYENKVLVSSTQQDKMDAFRAACPSVATSATVGETAKFYVFSRLGLVGLYKPKFTSLQVPLKSGNITVMSKGFAHNAHKWGLKVINWTIDTPEQSQQFVNLGTDGVNTSYPKRIIESLK